MHSFADVADDIFYGIIATIMIVGFTYTIIKRSIERWKEKNFFEAVSNTISAYVIGSIVMVAIIMLIWLIVSSWPWHII